MNQKFDLSTGAAERIVYIRAVAAADLPDDLREQIGDDGVIYAVHNAAGERLALVRDREMAFHLARQNDMAPVSVN